MLNRLIKAGRRTEIEGDQVNVEHRVTAAEFKRLQVSMQREASADGYS